MCNSLRPPRNQATTQPAQPHHPPSSNSQFAQLVKTLNSGARLAHALRNWENTLAGIHRQIANFRDSIRPPLLDDTLITHLSRDSDSYATNVTGHIQNHLTSHLTQLAAMLQTLDQKDIGQNRSIAISQLTKSIPVRSDWNRWHGWWMMMMQNKL